MWTVYLLRVEGDELPFYVGCTSRTLHERWLEHKSRLKKIELWPSDDSIIIEGVGSFEDQTSAEEEESRLIARYGRAPIGCLTNNNTGGMGGHGVARDDTRSRCNKKISAFDEQGHYVGTYPSAREADRKLNVNFSSISQMLRKGARSVKSRDGKIYQFRFGDDQSAMDSVVYKSRWHGGTKLIRGGQQ